MSIQELCEAAAAGDLHAVKKITMVDPKLVDQYEDGCNPLHNAASSGHLSIVEHLIEQCHANVNSHKIRAAQQDPWTALDYAARNRDAVMFEYLLEQGAHLSQDENIQSMLERQACWIMQINCLATQYQLPLTAIRKIHKYVLRYNWLATYQQLVTNVSQFQARPPPRGQRPCDGSSPSRNMP